MTDSGNEAQGDSSRAEDAGLPSITPDFGEQELEVEFDDFAPSQGFQRLPMAGLGASAGGIEALQNFFKQMPLESGMAFVAVMHLASGQEGALDRIIASVTSMPVLKAKDGEAVKPNTVYVMPPSKFLMVTGAELKLTGLEQERGKGVAGDLFFRSLADTYGPHSAVNAPVEVFQVPLELEGQLLSLDIRVCPAQEVVSDYLLVVFEVQPRSHEVRPPAYVEGPAVRHLERENEALKRRLRDVIEQYEASGEELKAGNEELQAMYEEMRSSAEELETSREELQSINEELTTLNQQLKCKVDELSQVNSEFSNLMAATGVATILLDRSLKITRYTPAEVGLFNIIHSDLGRPLADITHVLDYPDLRKDAESVLRTLVPVTKDVSDGRRWFLAQIQPYRTAEDQIMGLVLSFVDVTESRAAQEALRESEEHLRLVLENVREYAIFSLDFERRVKSWNSGAERLLGYSGEEILGESADVIFTAEDREEGAPQLEATTALNYGRAADERWHVRKDGTRFWGSGVMMAMHGGDGTQVGLVKVFCDQTEKREAQEALERSRLELNLALEENKVARATAEQATQAKDRFMAMLSHELRTPLTPMLFGLHLLQKREDLPDGADAILGRIRRNAELLKRFIDELLDMSRVTHGKMELLRVPLDLHGVLRAAIEVSKPEIDGKKQKLEVRLDAAHSRLSGDADRLQQVFWNLLKNASKFTPEGGSIGVTTSGSGESIRVHVTDTGIGFAPEFATQIFEAFHQVPGDSTKKSSGLGLGLAIANAAVVGHDGQITAESLGEGQGATFTVALPLLPRERGDLRTRPCTERGKARGPLPFIRQ